MPLQTNTPRSLFLKEFLALLFPFLLWIFLFHGFLTGQLAIVHDAPLHYFNIKYYMDSILQGVYPMWNPFHAWGSLDNFDVRTFGEMNPFLYVIALLNLLGVSFFSAFLIYLVLYYFIGLAGFFLLAKRIFQDFWYAFVAYVLLLFSSLGAALFTEHIIVLLFVPIVWFFYFLIGLVQTKEKRFIYGITFSLMIIATTYLPFFFITILASFLIFFFIFYFSQWNNILFDCWECIKTQKKAIVFCVLSLSLALIPGLMWHQSTQDSQYVMRFRHSQSPDAHLASMHIDTIDIGGISGPVSEDEIFSGLNFLSVDDYIFFYVPIFFYLVILLSLFNKGSRRLSVLLFTALFIFLISLTNVTPVHRFLYDHVYFFKLFRNMYFFLYLIMPALILFCVEQLRIFLNVNPRSSGMKTGVLLFIGLIHGLFLWFLNQQVDVVLSSYAVTGLSALFFVSHTLGVFKKSRLAMFVLLTSILLIHPVEVYSHFSQNSKAYETPFPHRRQTPQFSFVRPTQHQEPHFAGHVGLRRVKKVMRDKSGFLDRDYFGVGWSYALHENIARGKISDYVRYKFLLYDQVEYMSDPEVDFIRIGRALERGENRAFVFEGEAAHDVIKGVVASGKKAQKITEASDQFRVIGFGLNFIKLKTNFAFPKFLVYNDSFHKNWQVFINGKKVKILRANIAFKGIWLPAGENTVHFRFSNPWRHGLNFFLIGFFMCFLGVLIFSFRRNLNA